MAEVALRVFGRVEEALALAQGAFQVRSRELTRDNFYTTLALADIAGIFSEKGSRQEACALREQVVVRMNRECRQIERQVLIHVLVSPAGDPLKGAAQGPSCIH